MQKRLYLRYDDRDLFNWLPCAVYSRSRLAQTPRNQYRTGPFSEWRLTWRAHLEILRFVRLILGMSGEVLNFSKSRIGVNGELGLT
jgi:hypothetical protein